MWKDTANNLHLIFIDVLSRVIIIGDKVYIAEKRKVYYSVEDYMVYGQYKIDKTIITFYINPDNG